MDSLKGKLLVAAPQMQDPNFSRTVVLIVQHNEEGAMGLVLNRQTELTFEAIWEQITEAPPCEPPADRLFSGGPCEGPVMFLDGHKMALETLKQNTPQSSDSATKSVEKKEDGQAIQVEQVEPEDHASDISENETFWHEHVNTQKELAKDTDGTLGAEVIPGLFFGADVTDVFWLIEQNKGPRSFFLGFAGWGSMQLEMELATGSWFVWPAKPEHIFDRERGSWAAVANEIQVGDVLKPLEGKHWPSDPSLN